MGKRTRATFSPEFRQEVVDLVIKQDYSIREAAESMGVGKSTVDKWVRQSREIGATGAPIGAEQQRIKELEKELRRIKEHNEILKKASALLMSDSLKNLR